MIKAEYERYARQITLNQIGIEGQLRLKKAKVLVIGIGGLGCPLLQYVVSAGVGQIGLMDGDNVSVSNLQRQVLFSDSDIGKNKAEVASQKLQVLNPYVRFNVFPSFLTAENSKDVMDVYDIIVDCTDNFTSRYLINDVAIKINKPVVYAALFKFQGQVSVFNYKEGPSYRCLFPKQNDKQETQNCSEAGVWSVLPGIIGCMQANELLKMIVGVGEVLSGKLLTYDSINGKSLILKFKKNKEQVALAMKTKLEVDYCSIDTTRSLDREQFEKVEAEDNVLVIDLREPEELEKEGFRNAVNFPFSQKHNWENDLPKEKKILLFCAGGKRSSQTLRELLAKNYDVYELKNGLLLNAIVEQEI